MDLITLIEVIYFSILWLCLGSFINALEYRTRNNISINWRSWCPKCNFQLKWYHNIPLFSYIFLWGKCANCKNMISIQYPLVELLSAIVFLCWFLINLSQNIFTGYVWYIALAFFLFSIVYISVYDLKYKEIPTNSYFILAIPALYLVFISWTTSILYVPLYWLIWPVFFIAIDYIAKFYWTVKQKIWLMENQTELPDTIWGWDIKMAIPLGIIVWYIHLNYLPIAIIWAYFVGCFIILPLYYISSLSKNTQEENIDNNVWTEIPFWPMMLISSFLAVFYWKEILSVISSLLI
jgi:leader peptidase (prepilin peptidase)/N-methyltransferase